MEVRGISKSIHIHPNMSGFFFRIKTAVFAKSNEFLKPSIQISLSPFIRLLKINPQSKDGLVLKGWVEVGQLRESRNKNNALQYFESVLKTNNRNIEALFGKAKYFELCGHFDESNQVT